MHSGLTLSSDRAPEPTVKPHVGFEEGADMNWVLALLFFPILSIMHSANRKQKKSLRIGSTSNTVRTLELPYWICTGSFEARALSNRSRLDLN